ncbi:MULTISPECIES: hypothetical protein [Burkholderia]|nr:MULTISPECIES: hypothetical protein [Burkholderia]MDN7785966.1 hypothetical protein [Burkholderia contaminans]
MSGVWPVAACVRVRERVPSTSRYLNRVDDMNGPELPPTVAQ